MLDIRNISYCIAGQQVLDGLSLSLKQGSFYALAGGNGAGKSTLIKIILDLIRNVDEGQVTVNGCDHKLLAARSFIAYLPEKFDVKNDVTGWQYIKFVFGIYQQTVSRERVMQLCEKMELDFSRLDHKTNGYSKGMKQKLGLISCFMLDKPLIVLDEPLSGLDPKARYHFKELLSAERDNQRTVFYSTHMLADAEEICDQFGILHQGRIVFDGSPETCLKQFNANTLEQAYMSCIIEFDSALVS